ncbi:MAG: hypothetical protein N4A62_16235 [Marinisporobacter sp.]|jgi:predicted Fe-Mo cluster-binding NifX family protein|nr:hypothetical protein [Marinisporobacter sp.]
MPYARAIEPSDLEEYDHFQVDGINIYVYKGARVENTLKLVLRNYLLFKQIEIQGISIL